LDTGADSTIISVNDWKKLGSPNIHRSDLKLECYSGKPLNVKDECQVKVDHNGQTFHLLMVVVHEVGTPLLGLQWIREMQLNLNNLIYGSNYSQRPIGKIYSQTKFKQILEKHKEVFKEGLGHCTKVQAHIKLKPNVIPKFFKPRPIAFAHLERVKDEIQRNIEAGILEKVDTSM
jgi:predicted aspartyl protease